MNYARPVGPETGRARERGAAKYRADREYSTTADVRRTPGIFESGKKEKPAGFFPTGFICGGEEEDRTPDLCIANAALSQLSYPPTES